MATLKVGDIVQLNSGGPKMTVNSIMGERVFVAWFDEKGDLHKNEFRPQALKFVEIENAG